MSENYKIVNLHAENIKKLKVIDITPDRNGNIVTLTGRNGQGKTSIMDCIMWAIAGKKAFQDQPQPIRNGEKKAEIRINLGKIIVRRTFTEKDSYIFVEAADGAKISKPQDLLNELFGAIAFDPLEFTRQDEKKQYEILRGLVTLDVDIDHLNALNAGDMEKRRDIKRDHQALLARIDGMVVAADTPDQPIDVAQLAADGQRAGELQAQIASNDAAVTTNLGEIDRAQKEIVRLTALIDDLNAKNASLVKATGACEVELAKIGDIDDLREKYRNAAAINQAVAKKQERDKMIVDAHELEIQINNYTEAMEGRDAEKQRALKDAKMPVPGLSFDDGKVFYNGDPLTQISTAEQIRISTAIAMAMNPQLRVIQIKDGSLLDDQSMDIIRGMAKDHDFQVWIEVVNSTDPMAVVIEDGAVVAQEKAA